jgi:hypothetical protein
MPRLTPGIHAFIFVVANKDVDGRDEPGHDEVYEGIFHGDP